MKWILYVLLLTLIWGTETPKQETERPNILFIAVDDLNDWTSLFDADHPIKIPNIEQLAARGAFFRRAYCSSPACNPSRASIMTGTRPHKTGIYGNASDWRSALPEATTLQKFFKDRGYFVGGAGKIFHHHRDWAYHDNASFHEYLMMSINEPYPPQKLNGLADYGSRNTDWGPWPERVEETADFRTAEYATQFLQRRHDQPFFLNIGIYKPHSPFFAPAEYFAAYPGEQLVMPNRKADDWEDLPSGAEELMRNKKWFWNGMMKALRENPNAWRDYVRAYQACAGFADDMIGRVIAALDASPYRDNTIIVLWSDHGFHLGEKDHFEKFALWEKTNHIPYIIIAPGVTSPGMVLEQPVDLTSLYPTLVDLCGFAVPESLDGISLVPVLKDSTITLPPALMTYGRDNHALRTERWRYIRYRDGSEELYDHTRDPNEWDNLADRPEYRKIMDELARQLPTESAEPVADL
ncbi:sulfatase [Flavilitoribacter nigricans]|uniref:Iduronate-2-sulfatase n=1 Tax=Flavilitoribacter nigricans (strain ATCC 23147 / DSM 23189 / NBRC 102662 / NCIMB 1420 / SS-2) TaxID=1122177 RepID=A0A2D0NC42_FLAN2|nr:sulfatase [Flavilitoribacter nigricans]PHN05930.1 iduronate-2-sulfatase [Flavilitoribacter nigricans DSM 23189 = NBRC 102662]